MSSRFVICSRFCLEQITNCVRGSLARCSPAVVRSLRGRRCGGTVGQTCCPDPLLSTAMTSGLAVRSGPRALGRRRRAGTTVAQLHGPPGRTDARARAGNTNAQPYGPPGRTDARWTKQIKGFSNVFVNPRSQGFKSLKRKSVCISNGFA